MIDFYGIPICWMNRIKNGEDYVTDEGEVIANERLTTPADPPRAYAYCSDTSFLPRIVEQIQGVDLLFHEATFVEADAARARQTQHSTAGQAATIARDAGVGRLVIGHYSARYNDETELLQEAQAIFPHTQLAQENLCIEL